MHRTRTLVAALLVGMVWAAPAMAQQTLSLNVGWFTVRGIADRVPERVRHLVYLDAFVPRDGQSLNDLVQTGGAAAHAGLDGWLVPPNPSPPDTSADDVTWITARRRHQPARTFAQKLHLRHAAPSMPRSYIYCARKAPAGDPFAQFAARFRDDPTCSYLERDWSHSPNVTAPEALAELLSEIAAKKT